MTDGGGSTGTYTGAEGSAVGSRVPNLLVFIAIAALAAAAIVGVVLRLATVVAVAASSALVIAIATESRRIRFNGQTPALPAARNQFPTGRFLAIVATASLAIGYVAGGVGGAVALAIFAVLAGVAGLKLGKRMERRPGPSDGGSNCDRADDT